MNRINACLTRLKQENKKALVTYIVNGDPRPDVTLKAMQTLVECGADIIELGVPFSDPMAEGPVIQRGHERALENAISLKSTMELVSKFRKQDQTTPVVLMGYANPVERLGYESFADLAQSVGVDGLLTVDLPPEESQSFNSLLQSQGVETISLIAPTTTESRVADIANISSGFLYYVSLKGVTGAAHLDIDSVVEKVELIRGYSSLPILVGFGIKDADSAKSIGQVADGVVVGSVLVNAMGEDQEASDAEICEKLANIIKPMRAALDL